MFAVRRSLLGGLIALLLPPLSLEAGGEMGSCTFVDKGRVCADTTTAKNVVDPPIDSSLESMQLVGRSELD